MLRFGEKPIGDLLGARVRCPERMKRAVASRPPLQLWIIEENTVLGILNSDRFVDLPPASVFATRLDVAQFHGSIRIKSRLLKACDQCGESRKQRVHPVYKKTELLATAVNEVWSWVITKLKVEVK